ARQISNALINDQFSEFEKSRKTFAHRISFTDYSKDLSNIFDVLFPAEEIKNSLGEVISNNNLTQLRTAETEKYAHVTFFFSCGQEVEFSGEKRELIKSPNVATYDLQPEMSAIEVGQNLRKAISSGQYDLIIVNYANPDMVGHSGKLEPAIKACEVIDNELGLLETEILKNNGQMLITADHGNIECMRDENNKPHTSHTTNLVPFILVTNKNQHKTLKNGSLKDIAPTILNLLDLEKPTEMTGDNLLS
ncbi:MAG: 2,3-bisphosphoglycerate-independent phosphoglycerate mutase, partial [Rickettsiales bacterium]|nr:2,3-bisphosphoglycerate-independent phosphoglycerate mutase [Rickettsiales bacterium]